MQLLKLYPFYPRSVPRYELGGLQTIADKHFESLQCPRLQFLQWLTAPLLQIIVNRCTLRRRSMQECIRQAQE